MRKKLLLTLCALFALGLCATAQTPDEIDIETDETIQLEMVTPAEPVKETKKERKEREKKMRELNDDIAFAKASNSMRRGYFVFLADNIQLGRSGFRDYSINSNANFLLVQDFDVVLQYALNMGRPGANGLGGWTGKGALCDKRIKTLKNGDIFMQFNVVSPKVNATVDITLFHNSNRGVAHIYGGKSITFYGRILPYRDKDHR